MPTQQITLQRVSVISAKPFAEVIKAIESVIGHPDMASFEKDVASARTLADLETLVNKAIGPSGFMEFARFNLGEVIRKDRDQAPKMLRLVIGNPLIMKQMAEHVADAGSYAPVTILVDERPEGVHLAYDRMATLLAPYGNVQALKVARALDEKVESLLTSAAA